MESTYFIQSVSLNFTAYQYRLFFFRQEIKHWHYRFQSLQVCVEALTKSNAALLE